MNVSSFGKIDWKKEWKRGRVREMHAGVLAWLCNPYGDYRLGSAVLEPLLAHVGGGTKNTKQTVERIAHNVVLDGHGAGRVLDMMIETDIARFVCVSPLTLDALRPVDSGSLLDQVTSWLADNLARGIRNTILLITPITHNLPGDIDDEVHTNGYVRMIPLIRLIDILERLLGGVVSLLNTPKVYAALQRYILFLRIYILDIHPESPLAVRLKNIRALV